MVIREVAKAIGVHRTTLHRWLNNGKVQPFLIASRRLIPESEIEWLRREMQGAELSATGALHETRPKS